MPCLTQRRSIFRARSMNQNVGPRRIDPLIVAGQARFDSPSFWRSQKGNRYSETIPVRHLSLSLSIFRGSFQFRTCSSHLARVSLQSRRVARVLK